MKKTKLKAIDFFCSGGGMSFGMQQAGVDVLGGVDFDEDCKETYESNVKGAKFVLADVTDMKNGSLTEEFGVKKNDDNLVLIGCSPCQYWTIIRTTKAKSEKSKNLLHEFHRFVKFYNPGYVVVENVPGILKKKKESGLDRFVIALEKQGYAVKFEVVSMDHYGVPEARKRFSLVATRLSKEPAFPKAGNKLVMVRDVLGLKNGFPKISAGHNDDTSFRHTASALSEKNLKRLKLTPKNGGSRQAWANTNLQLDTYKRNGEASFSDAYGRISWDKPAPTITTKFTSISNGRFAHPEENRGLSLREGATLQTFPKSYKFFGNKSAVARMIGNAVPPLYAKKIAQAIIQNHDSRK